jgi:hypothetical protein
MARKIATRRRGTLEKAYDRALAELPAELRPMVISYAENMRAGQEIRSELSTAMTACGAKWYTVDGIAHKLAFA